MTTTIKPSTGVPDIKTELYQKVFDTPWAERFLAKTGNSKKMLLELIITFAWSGAKLPIEEYCEAESRQVLIADYKKMAITSENLRRQSNQNTLETKGLNPEDVGLTEEDLTPLEVLAA